MRAGRIASSQTTDAAAIKDELYWNHRLSKEQKIDLLRNHLRRRAEAFRTDAAAVTYRETMENIFNDHMTHNHAYNLMETAAEDQPAFIYGTHNGQKRLRYNSEAEQASPEGDSPTATPNPDPDTSGSSAAESGDPAPTAADGGLDLGAAVERLRETFDGRDDPDPVRSQIAYVSGGGVAPEDVPDDAVDDIDVRPAGSEDSVLSLSDISFDSATSYTVLATGMLEDGSLDALLVADYVMAVASQ